MSVEPPIAVEELEEIICGDRDFLNALIEQFWLDLDLRLPQLQASVMAFDGPTVALLSHTIAGSAGCIGAEPLRRLAKELETVGQRRNPQQAGQLLKSLEDELERVRKFLATY